MMVYGVYLGLLGVTFLVWPNPVITFLGFAPVTDIWIHILGLVLLILSGYFYLAIREGAVNVYRWSSYGRFPVFFVFLVFVLLEMAPPVLLLFGLVDLAAALWTGLALRAERQGLCR